MTEFERYRSLAASLVSLTDEELYIRIVPADLANQAHAPGALGKLGKEIVQNILRKARTAICNIYELKKDAAKDSLDLIAIIATGIGGKPELRGVDAVAAVTIIVRLGLDGLCG
jgi:hypothetical protein